MVDSATPTAPPTGTHRASPEQLASLDVWWRAVNYLAAGQIYLLDNPLLRDELLPEHIKARLLGHWGTTPGLNLLWAHLNRLINDRDLDVVFICGPGHGGPAFVASAWLEGSYSEVYPDISRDGEGMQKLFRQFSFPGGIPSHAAPETPGSIHEGGELGYSLAHAYGAVLDNPDMVAACVIGDGEAETGPLAASWHANKFLDPRTDGVVLPILHLNGWKIANPAVLDRLAPGELTKLMEGYGHKPYLVEGEDALDVHRQLADTLDEIFDEIAAIQHQARTTTVTERPRWPMLILRTPKGWTGPKVVDGLPVEGTWRAHQVPLSEVRTNPEHLHALEQWLHSYRPEELFDEDGRPFPATVALAPKGTRRMASNPHANGGLLRRPLDLPDFQDFGVAVESPGAESHEPTRLLGQFLREIMRRDVDRRSFRLVGPDETESNRLGAVYDVTSKQWLGRTIELDQHLATDGRVLEILSEHVCQGWLEGYLLTGRHGLFSCYEAFSHIVDSMVNQHAKWLQVTRKLPWRAPISSLNYLLTSHVWRQDHNGFTHQDPGFIDNLLNKKPEVVRVYLPPDANCLLSVADHCLRSVDYVNVIVAGKQPTPSWLTMDEAVLHCARGLGIWDWAGTEGHDDQPDVVLACAGDVPTVETLAAADLLRQHLPELVVRVVNVVDPLRLMPERSHPHGMADREFDAIFTLDRPVIFAYHGYPTAVHRLTYNRANHANFHVHGYKEEGTTTTPFDMVMLNDLDRFRLVEDVIDRVPSLGARGAQVRQDMADRRFAARAWTRTHGEDHPDIVSWVWPASP